LGLTGFFGAKKEVNEHELRQFTELDFERRVGLVATLLRNGEEQIIGVGRYAPLNVATGEPSRAEAAFAVALDSRDGSASDLSRRCWDSL
jgi:hypothetical protein